MDRTYRGRASDGRGVSLGVIAAAVLLVGVAPSLADESIGGARIVVNLVTGALPSGNNVTVVQGDDVFRDEGVRTDASSSAKLVLLDSTNLSLGPSSAIKLDRFVYAGANQPGAITVNLVKGALRFATGDADKRAYIINTPTATLGVRGTILKIAATGADTIVALAEGAALVCPRGAGSAACVELTDRGQCASVTRTQAAVGDYPAHWPRCLLRGARPDMSFGTPSGPPGPGGGPQGILLPKAAPQPLSATTAATTTIKAAITTTITIIIITIITTTATTTTIITIATTEKGEPGDRRPPRAFGSDPSASRDVAPADDMNVATLFPSCARSG